MFTDYLFTDVIILWWFSTNTQTDKHVCILVGSIWSLSSLRQLS